MFKGNNHSVVLNVIQSLQFVSEYVGKPTDKRLYGGFVVFELGKLIVRFDKWTKAHKKQIYISESNPFATSDQQIDEEEKKFHQRWANLESSNIPVEEQLKAIKEQKGIKFNVGYNEVIAGKSVPLITTLPIPDALKQEKYPYRCQIGEIIFLIRPLIYCVLILKYGTHSYTPYLVSLVIDIIRFLIEKDLKLYKKSQKVEMNSRVREAILCYLLRNPFYQTILKEKIILVVLGKLFKIDGWIARLIIAIIEIRSSKTLLV